MLVESCLDVFERKTWIRMRHSSLSFIKPKLVYLQFRGDIDIKVHTKANGLDVDTAHICPNA